MKIEKIVEYLKCPYCVNKKLLLETKKKLVCEGCENDFSVIEGVPVLIKKECLGVQESNQMEWFNNHYSQFSNKKYQLENWRLSMLKRISEIDFRKNVQIYLDIGCGATGYTVIEAAKRQKWLSFGIDISIEAMLKAKALAEKQNLDGQTAFIVCSAEKLPFKPDLFDYVSAISLLEHLENDRLIIKSVYEILKKEGNFYICVPNTYKRIWFFLWPIYFYLDKNIGHKRHYSIEELNKRMEEKCFELERVFYNGHLIKVFQLILEKFRLIKEIDWWKLEEMDINQNSMGLQLNAIYKKICYEK